MAVWRAVSLGVLAGMAGFMSSSTLRQMCTNRLAVLDEHDGARVRARSNQDRSQDRSSFRASSRDNDPRRLESVTVKQAAVLPRILTVLTTYGGRSALVKEYKEAVFDREDGYHPTVSVSWSEAQPSDNRTQGSVSSNNLDTQTPMSKLGVLCGWRGGEEGTVAYIP